MHKIFKASLILFITACTTNMNQAVVEKNDADKVEFSIKVDPSTFSKDAELTVTLYDPVALKASEESANCGVAFDPTAGGAINNNCPDNPKSKGEEFKFSVSDVTDNMLKVTGNNVNVGEKYRLQISGKASDDCNTATAQHDGTAESAKVTLDSLMFSQTEKACLPSSSE